MNIIIKWGFWVYGWQLLMGLIMFFGVWPHVSFTSAALAGVIVFAFAPFVFVHDFTKDETPFKVERDTVYHIADNGTMAGLMAICLVGWFLFATSTGEKFMVTLMFIFTLFACGVKTSMLALGCSPYSNLREPRWACFIAAIPIIGPPLGFLVKRYLLPRLARTV